MAKFILQRLLIIPFLLLLVNFLGFTYAHYARPIRAARTPYVQVEEAGPLIPEYLNYLETLVNLDFGLEVATPDNSRSNTPVTLGETLAKATIASLGLLAVSLTISVILGLYLGFKATKNDPPDVSRWLTISSTVGLAMPSFYIGSLLIIGLIFFIIWRGPESDLPLPLSGYGWDAHLVLPVLALMARPTFQLAQVTAGVLSAELGKQYVIAGRSMGRTWRSIRMHFALKNVIAPGSRSNLGLDPCPSAINILSWIAPVSKPSSHGNSSDLNCCLIFIDRSYRSGCGEVSRSTCGRSRY